MASCPKHPRYNGGRRSRFGCPTCAVVYDEVHGTATAKAVQPIAVFDETHTHTEAQLKEVVQRVSAPVTTTSSGKAKGAHGYKYNSDELPKWTPDGVTWLDPDGNAPQVDDDGLLTAPFVLQHPLGFRERWGIGMKLPITPAVSAARRAAAAERDKLKGGKA